MNKATVGDADERIGRDELEARASKGAGALKALGVAPGDVVATLMRNDLAHLEAMRAAALAGARLCQLNWHGAAREVADILADSGAKALISHRDFLPALDGALGGVPVLAVTPGPAIRAAYGLSGEAAAARPDLTEWAAARAAAAPAAPEAMRPPLRYTSGSTGKPKGIRRKPRPGADFGSALTRTALDFMRFRQGARFLTAAPLYHSAPSTLTSMALALGDCDVTVLPRFDAERFLAAIEAARATHIYAVPTMFSRMLKLPDEARRRHDLSTIEASVSTGSPFPHDLKAAMIDWWGKVIWESYGASEIGFMTMVSPEEALARPGTAGRIAAGGSILILGPDGEPVPAGEVGDIHVRLEMFGDFDYSNEPEAKAERHGHVSVGDMGMLDEDGFLFISDRKKDMIISGGANIFPAEIEAALIEAPFVADAAVFGAPDPDFGEKIVAAIQPAPGWTPDEAALRAHLEGRLARMKHPRLYEFHAALPREDSGKVFKARLRAPHWAGAGRRI